MAKGLDEALGFLLDEEGGWSDHPADRGGKTMWGITQATYDDFRVRLKKLPKQSVSKVTKPEARELYDILYWRAAGCERFPWPVSYVTFDAAVNSGPNRAVRWTQSGLGVSADGKVGPATVAAAQAAVETGDSAAIVAILDQRVQFLVALVRRTPSQLAFLLGWWRRTQRVLGRAFLSSDED